MYFHKYCRFINKIFLLFVFYTDVVEPPMNGPKSSTWICHMCSKAFTKPHLLAWHLANIHFRDALVTINILV